MSDTTTKDKIAIETPWMTVQEVAVYLSVSPGTIRNWVSRRYIPHVKRGRVVRLHRDRIDEWLRRGACQGRSRLAPSLQSTGPGAGAFRQKG
jgi:excisionase family DNA binding protein